MTKFRVILIFTTFCGLNGPAFGTECKNFLQAIPQTVQRVYAIEKPEAGQIYPAGQKLPAHLESGFYIFLITSAGETLFAPKYDVVSFKQSGLGLNTHKSLLAMYKQQTGRDISNEILAAGEVQIAFGFAKVINDYSGNFRSRSHPRADERLEFVKNKFIEFGLYRAHETLVETFGKISQLPAPHSRDARKLDLVRLQMQLKVHEQAAELRLTYEEIGRLLREIFPDEPLPEVLEKHVLAAAISHAMKSGHFEGLGTFLSPLQFAYTGDGLDAGIYWTLVDIEQGKMDKSEGFSVSASQNFAAFIASFGDKMTVNQVARFEALIARLSLKN